MTTIPPAELDRLCVNAIRFLSIDAVQKANSGHPGMPLGAAPMAYVLWTRFLRHDPADPAWFDRDRFILSAGHGSMLLYSLLHLTGYDLTLDDLSHFRQWGSRTPGHPERGLTPGVEVTTGPLGQGFANGVGMAIAEAYLGERFNKPGFRIVDHYTYAIVSDGDLMEGVASEAASLAGHLGLGKLIYLYDDNSVTLSAAASLAFTEDRAARFKAYGWHTQVVEDGNDLAAIEAALRDARTRGDRPHLILIRTHLGYGAPHAQDTYQAHGAPLGAEEVAATRKNLGWKDEVPLHVPDEAMAEMRKAGQKGAILHSQWDAKMREYSTAFPAEAAELKRIIRGDLPEKWDDALPRFAVEPKGIATRVASGQTLSALASRLPEIIGGSGDLDPSTHTMLKGLGDFEGPDRPHKDSQGSAGGGWGFSGRNIHYGVREHAMGSITNGMAAHGGILPFAATFLVFSDYMRPPLRLSALMGLHAVFIFTHDSIGLGEDGPTHQPVEHLVSLRAIPGMTVLRPADANETAAAWKAALLRKGPAALVLSRQNLPVLDPGTYPGIVDGVLKGGYVLADAPRGTAPDVVLCATGSEVHLALEARAELEKEGVNARVASLPSLELFREQPASYRDAVIPPRVPRLSIEAGVTLGWRSYLEGDDGAIGVDRFGASAPGQTVMREYGLTAAHVCEAARSLLPKTGARK